MEKGRVIEKFGAEYVANKDTYHMGIHRLLAEPIAKRFSEYRVCLDACLGAGFMTLALAKYVDKIIGVDTNPAHLRQAEENLKIAGISNQVKLIEGNVLEKIKTLNEIDSAFLDPDWAKKGDDKEKHVSELSDMIPPTDTLLEKVFEKTQNVCLRLPKEFDLAKLNPLPPHESDAVYQGGKLKFYCIYFGDLIKKEGPTELRI